MEIKELMNLFAQPGTVASISIRPERMGPVKIVDTVLAIQNKGLEGDRSKGGNRQVTFIPDYAIEILLHNWRMKINDLAPSKKTKLVIFIVRV